MSIAHVQANATSVKESTISRTVESIEVRLNYIQFLAALADRAPDTYSFG
jgi:hypothetical protein